MNAEFLIAADGERDGWLGLDELLGAADPVAEAEPTGPESDCFWLYSSGSTGDPKASVHQGDDVGLRDGLPVADRERPVPVGVLPRVLRNEPVPRHAAHRLEDARIANAARRDLLGDHRQS